MNKSPGNLPRISRGEFLSNAGRLGVLAGTGLLGAVDGCEGPQKRENSQRYNFLMLKTDEHNPLFSEAEEHPFVQTPNMARLAQSGTIYENCYCPSPLCAPSRSSFLSGRPVHEIQTYNNCMVPLRPNLPTYGSVLGKQGVHTVFAGKADAYRTPGELGFTEMYGHTFRMGNIADRYISRVPLALRKDGARRAAGYGLEETEAGAFGRDPVTMTRALEFLSNTATGLGRPWTLEVNLDAPHYPHRVTRELWDLYAGHEDLPAYGEETASAQHPYARDLRRHFDTEKMKPVAGEHRRGYYARVTWADQQLGRLLGALEGAGLYDRTIVAYTSDHGEMLGKFGMWWKCSMFEDSVRVPLIVSGPGFAPGVRIRTPVSQWDLQASIFEAVGGKRPDDWHGEPLQRIPAQDEERAVFSEYHGHGTRASAFMVRKGRWKFVYNAGAPNQLYDLDEDPDELNNLAEAHSREATSMEKELREFCDPKREQKRAEQFIQRQLETLECKDPVNGCMEA